MDINIKKLVPAAKEPSYATDGSGCFDLYSLTAGVVMAGHPLKCSTGLAFEIPEGWVMEIYSRSGDGFNRDVRLANCVGIIDSDYRGEVGVKLTGDAGRVFEVKVGDRIAQAKLVPSPRCTFKVVDELSSTERGTGGFGSTGR
jgi:dUTP pyrophosphatase